MSTNLSQNGIAPRPTPAHPAHRPPNQQHAHSRENPQQARERQGTLWLARQPEPKRGVPEQADWRILTSQYNARIIELEEHKKHIPPVDLPQLTEALVDVRFKRDLFYGRLFRIQDLPPEILTHIFRIVIYSTSRNMKMVVKSRLWLTWVCRRWRDVTISDSTLWNAIWFKDPPPYHRSMAWFERAGTAPLDLRINEQHEDWQGKEDEHRFTKEDMTVLLDKLFTKLPQIRMLIVTVDNWPPALVVLDKLRQAGSAGIPLIIERFELHRAGKPYVWIGPGFTPDVHRHPIPLCGGRASRMKHVTLNGIHIDWHTSPLKDLTTLDIRRMALEVCPSTARFREMLRGCPHLHKLALDGAGPKFEPAEAARLQPVELPNLKILVLGDFSNGYARYALSHIKAPNVRDLTLMNMNGEDYSPLLVDMTSCFKEVRILTLYTIEMDDDPSAIGILVRWLHSMPLISYLRVAQVPDHVLQAFLHYPEHYGVIRTITGSNAPFRPQPVCPKLCILEYQSMPIDPVVDFGEGRKVRGHPLRKIYVNSPWVPKVIPPDAQRLMRIASLYIAPMGSNTEEETEALNS